MGFEKVYRDWRKRLRLEEVLQLLRVIRNSGDILIDMKRKD